jgi:hypothetical protein
MGATPEQLEFRKRWVEALRSGNWKQGKYCLRSVDGSFCCLGVAAELLGRAGYHDVRIAAGMGFEDESRLIRLNDRHSFDFAQIAACIESGDIPDLD